MNEQAERVPRTLSARGQALLPVTPWREARESQDRVEVDHVSMHALRRLACHQPASAEPSGPPTPTRGRLMPWAKLDDRFHENRKIRRVWRRQPIAIGLHVMAITYCAGNLTDGFVDEDFVEERVPDQQCRQDVVDALTDTSLWHPVEGGWEINDFSEFNMTREQAERTKGAKSEAGRRGGLSKARREAITQATRHAVVQRMGVSIGETKAVSCAYCDAPITIVRDEKRVRMLDVDGRTTPELHHVRSVYDGGTNDPENLVVSCLSCNRSKGAQSFPPSDRDLALASDLSGRDLAGASSKTYPRPDPTRPEPDPTYEADADASPSRRRLSASSKEVAKASEDDKRLCRLFADLATKRNEKAKVGSYAEWLRSMRLMREQDGHTPDEIERAVRWLFEDKCDDAQFWSSTIQAPSGLREHFAQVWAKLQRPVRATRDPQQAAVDADRQAAMRRLRGAA